MFNSLQEGILVYDLQPAEELQESVYELIFANSLFKAIFGHVSPNAEKTINLENKVLYQYQSATVEKPKRRNSRQRSQRSFSSINSAFSLMDLLNMKPDDLAQRVFTFSEEH